MPEARDRLRELTEHATQRHFVYEHRWRRYDFVMWDNRQIMHRVRRFRDDRDVRDMRRTPWPATSRPSRKCLRTARASMDEPPPRAACALI